MKKLFFIGVLFFAIALTLFFVFIFVILRAPDPRAPEGLFVISKTNIGETDQRLLEGGYVRSRWSLAAARILLRSGGEIKPGGYKISKAMNTSELIKILTSEPQLKWITIPEGLRKEQIGERLAEELHWNDNDLTKWNQTYTAMEYDFREGVYFPDTYLIPVDENGLDTAKRMIRRFNERFSGYTEKFAEKDVLWTTGLKIASIIQREAAGKEDMHLISGIIWNRLLNGKKLEIDATVQYARGKTDSGWWSPLKPGDIDTINSPYNTYKNKGLPPTPISNPGMDAIEAALNPEQTDCFYYLHDKQKKIHCSKTFEEHRRLVEQYLR